MPQLGKFSSSPPSEPAMRHGAGLHGRRIESNGRTVVRRFFHFAYLMIPLTLGLASCVPKSKSADFAETIEPILAKYCYDCHADGIDKGDIELDQHLSLEEMMADRGMWEGVYSNLDTRLMPPSDKKQPDDAERAQVLAWIEDAVFQLNRKNPDPGKPVIRRLNRTEYNYAIRDLFGISLQPADKFPADDTGYGFDNIGEVLSLSPTLFEKYIQASEEVMDVVIPTQPVPPKSTLFNPGSFKKRKGNPDPDTGTMSSSGTLGIQFQTNQSGRYEFRITARGSRAKNEWPIIRAKVENGPQKDLRVSSDRRKEYTVSAYLKHSQKPRWFDVSFINDLYDPKAKDPSQRDRNVFINRIEVVGPIEDKPPAPIKVYQDWLTRFPEKSDAARARKILEHIAYRAWRRPLTDSDLDRLTGLYEAARKDGQSFEESLKLSIKGILISQRFLFRGESENVTSKPEDAAKYAFVDEYSLASRLSFFLWSSIPDDELLNLAGEGKLRSQLRTQVTRMLADKRSLALTDNFAGQWLQLRNIEIASPDPKQFKSWNESLKNSMRTETEQFFTYIIRENRPVLDFIDADYSFLDQRMADHYGMKDRVKDSRFQKVVFTEKDRSRRGGLLTHASILTITSDATRTSPVNRGNYVLENILGTIPPPPPEGLEIPPLEAAGKGQKNLTLRQQLEIHREDKLCSSCHARMDPIGFAMENYDAFGKWRDQEHGQPIDTSGVLYTGEAFEGITGLRALLAEKKSEAFMKCLSEKLLTYALGRGVEYYDKPALNQIVKQTQEKGFRSHELITAIIESVPFQKTRVVSTAAP